MDAYHLYRGSEASMELPDIEIAQGCRKETLEEWATHAKLPVYVDTDITKLTFLKKDGDTAEIKKVWSDPISLPVKKADAWTCFLLYERQGNLLRKNQSRGFRKKMVS